MENNDPNKTTPPAGDPNTGNNGGQGEKTFTQDELNDVVSNRLKAEKEKTEKATQAAIAEAVRKATEEAERKAKLSSEEREKEEAAKRQHEFEKKELEVTIRERRIEAKSLMQEKNIPLELVDFIVDPDEKKTKENVETLEQAFNKAVEKAVSDKVAGKAPKDPASAGNKEKSGGFVGAF